MGEESVDLRKEIAQAKEQINSPDDALADIAIKLQETELQSKLLKVQIEQATLEKENLRIERLRRNNERRPFIFCGVAFVIVLMYLGLISILVRDLWFPCPGLVRVLDRGYFIEVILLAVVPTVLVALLMKAVFSATPKKEQDSEIKISDAIPLKLITSNIEKTAG